VNGGRYVGFLYKKGSRSTQQAIAGSSMPFNGAPCRQVGTTFAFNTMPKRSVTALDNENGQEQDLDARRKITTKTRRSESNNNKNALSPVTVFAVTSFDKKEHLAPPLTPRGFLFARPTAAVFAMHAAKLPRCWLLSKNPGMRNSSTRLAAHSSKLTRQN